MIQCKCGHPFLDTKENGICGECLGRTSCRVVSLNELIELWPENPLTKEVLRLRAELEILNQKFEKVKDIAKWEELERCDPSGTWYDVAQTAMADRKILMDAMMCILSDDPNRPQTAQTYANELCRRADSWERTCRKCLNDRDAAFAQLEEYKKLKP